MSIKEEPQSNIIKIPFPHRKFRRYLESVDESSVEKLNNTQVETIFRQAIRDFLAGKVSLDELSVISQRLWWRLINKDKELSKTELGETLHFAGELNFYVRSVSRTAEPEIGSVFIQFLSKVIDFAKER